MISVLEGTVSEARAGFSACLADFDELAVSLIGPPSMLLSRLLIGTILIGDRQPNETAICSCRALELLDHALLLGQPARNDGGVSEDKLLVADYLYARSIDQVIETGEPKIIGMLARSIMRTSESRIVAGVPTDSRRALIAAALEIGSHIGRLEGPVAEAVSAATNASLVDGSVRLIRIFPQGPDKDHLAEVFTPADHG